MADSQHEEGIVLAIDTALNGCSVAVADLAAGKSSHLCEKMSRGQAERLVPMINEVFSMAGTEAGGVSHIVVTTGPGAFTGMRIGLSAAKSFGLALDITVSGIKTTEALTKQYCSVRGGGEGKNILVVIDTKRSDYYFQLFDERANELTAPLAGDVEFIRSSVSGDLTVIGDAAYRFAGEYEAGGGGHVEVTGGFELPDPVVLAVEGFKAWQRSPDEYAARPVYVRQADVSRPNRTCRSVNANGLVTNTDDI